jgi:hypothetical protein
MVHNCPRKAAHLETLGDSSILLFSANFMERGLDGKAAV